MYIGTNELYDMVKAPKQYTNLFSKPDYAELLAGLTQKLMAKLVEVSN